jgi:hypothetical protein
MARRRCAWVWQGCTGRATTASLSDHSGTDQPACQSCADRNTLRRTDPEAYARSIPKVPAAPSDPRAELLDIAERIARLGCSAVVSINIEDPALLELGDNRTTIPSGLQVYESAIIQKGEVEIELYRYRPAAEAVRPEEEPAAPRQVRPLRPVVVRSVPAPSLRPVAAEVR